MSQNLKNTLTINKYMSQRELMCFFFAPHYNKKVATGRGVRSASFPTKSEAIVRGSKNKKAGAGFPVVTVGAGQFDKTIKKDSQ